MIPAASAADLVVALVALGAGILVGSLPVASGAMRRAGPGSAFLAFTADLAKGVIPVAVGVVTVSWAIGWIAGIGAILGSTRSARRRSGSGHEIATPAGVALALAPPAGAMSACIGLVVLGGGRMLGRDARDAALAVTTVAYPLLFAALLPDAASLGGLLGLYVVVAVVLVATRRRA